MRRSLYRLQQWIVDGSKQGQVFRSLRSEPVPDHEFLHRGVKHFHPIDVIDAKAEKYHTLWSEHPVTPRHVSELMSRIRVEAASGELPELTVQDLRAALREMRASAGHGIDQFTQLDLERLPYAALESSCQFFTACEQALTWPWQVLAVLGKLLAKKSEGDRVIGLLCMVCRPWSLARDGHA
eukprot:2501920-Pyramimonas_sp.AAC.1